MATKRKTKSSPASSAVEAAKAKLEALKKSVKEAGKELRKARKERRAGERRAKADEKASRKSARRLGKRAVKDLVDTAVAAGSFKTLAAGLQAADLIAALKGKGPFTVFAPSDDAFAKLPKGTLDTLLKPVNKDKLQGILLYHVVKGRIPSSSIKGSAAPKTLQGAALDVKAGAKGVTVNGAKVIKADVTAKNGVIHVIDAVLLPPKA
jgi:uncharacterized surface protein with fasciclin (FAS1) repeats